MQHMDTQTFLNWIAVMNHLAEDGPGCWEFPSGMGFGDNMKWWGDRGPRSADHEGIDVCLYRTGSGELRHIAPGNRVPAADGGEIAACCPDFLGVSIFLRHGPCGPGRCRYSIYGHTVPLTLCVPGHRVSRGEPIATVAPVATDKNRLLPHVHFSVAIIPTDIPPRDLTWKVLAGCARVEFLDPLHNLVP